MVFRNETLEQRSEKGKLIAALHDGRDLQVNTSDENIRAGDILIFSNGQQTLIDRLAVNFLFTYERGPVTSVVARTYEGYRRSCNPDQFPILGNPAAKEYFPCDSEFSEINRKLTKAGI